MIAQPTAETQADRNRNESALNLALRHLAERNARHITARQVYGKLIWSVESQTKPGTRYTVTREADGWPADTCACEDSAYRHMVCKHRRAVDMVMPAPAPAPAEWSPTGGWLSQRKVARVQIPEEV